MARSNSWVWKVEVQKIILDESRGLPRVRPLARLGTITIETANTRQQEAEVVYSLVLERTYKTADGRSFIGRETPLWHLLRREEDGHYRLIFWKQTPSAWLEGRRDIFGFYGYAIVRKIRDVIFFDTKYFQCGVLNPANLLLWNPREMIRNENESRNPLVFDMPWDRFER